jgi:hypothetical protein
MRNHMGDKSQGKVATFFKSPLVRTVLATSLGTGFSAWIGLFTQLPSWVTSAYEHLVTRAPTGQVSPTQLGVIVIDVGFVFAVLCVAVVGFYGPTIWSAKVESLRQEQTNSVRLRFLDPASELFSSQVYASPPVRYSALEWEVRIEPGYGGVLFNRWTWQAVDQIVYVRNLERGCSAPAEGLDCIELQASVLEGPGKVVAVPAADDLHLKHFLLFPIPPLRPDEAPRRVEVSGKWPRAFEKLERPDVWDYHSFALPPGAVAPIDSVKLRITFPSDRRFEVHEDFQPETREFDGAVYEATLRNVQHGMKIALKIKRLK